MRLLSDIEKDFVSSINSGKCKCLGDLLEPYCSDMVIYGKESGDNEIWFELNVHNSDSINKKIKEIQSLIIQSVNLLKLLENEGYIFNYLGNSVYTDGAITVGSYIKNQNSSCYSFPDIRISELLSDYLRKDIFVTPELNVFVKTGFQTREENRFQKQIFYAIIAIGISNAALFYEMFKDIHNPNQKMDQLQFKTIIEHIDNNKTVLIFANDSLKKNQNNIKDKIVIKTNNSNQLIDKKHLK